MTNVSFDKTLLSSIDEAYVKYRNDEFESPTRSTIPLLSWLKHEPKGLESLDRQA